MPGQTQTQVNPFNSLSETRPLFEVTVLTLNLYKIKLKDVRGTGQQKLHCTVYREFLP